MHPVNLVIIVAVEWDTDITHLPLTMLQNLWDSITTTKLLFFFPGIISGILQNFLGLNNS
jgi:hypothetical protein